MKEELVLACECGETLKISTLRSSNYETYQMIWGALHKGHEQVSCREAADIRFAEKKRIKRLETKQLAARLRVADWIATERKEYSDKKWAEDTEHREKLKEDILVNGISDDSEQWVNICNYLGRAKVFGIDTPQGSQLLAKTIVVLLHTLETVEEEYRVLPPPGVPSGTILYD
jgi:hypothetical protein